MSWKAEYIILIIISTLVDYIAGKKIYTSNSRKEKKFFLWLSILVNIGILFGFKYFNFFNESTGIIFGELNLFYNIPQLEVLLPVGISFYTFQTLSYTIDIYRGKTIPESHLGIFALYVSFFPQLVAGPIERSNNLLPQFKRYYYFEYNRVVSGLRLMLFGLFKKVVIADRLAEHVNQVYNSPDQYFGISIIMATILFAFQIYCDFSGYSDIAIGAARVMGIRLMINFNLPYSSRSISEFWKRWHISLSSWFKDYFYIALGGNRVVKWKWYYNLLLTFLVSGLWHGANWTFLLWGLLHGIYMISAIFKNKIKAFLFPNI